MRSPVPRYVEKLGLQFGQLAFLGDEKRKAPLLKGNLSSWGADDREALVKSLLDAVGSKRVTDSP